MGKEGIGVWFFQALFQKLKWFEQPASYPHVKKNSQLIFPLFRVSSCFTFFPTRLSSVILSSVLFLELCSTFTFAQVITNITPDGSLGTKVPPGCAICDITGGTRPGNGGNLFHSFQEFNVGPSGVANFLNDSGKPTSNILSRVTGGDPSTILGRIQTDGFGKANLFLMNPYGIVFGQNATLHVGGAAYFTTADYLRLDDGVQFTALPSAQDALLSIAPVAAFGFLGTNPGGGISVVGSTLSVGEVGKGETLSLVGGNIEITGGKLRAPDGQINLVSINSAGTVPLGEGADLQVNVTQLGQINLSNNSAVNVDGEVGGEVVIRSGQLILDNSVISANTSGLPEGQSVGAHPQPEINIQVTKDMLVDHLSSIETNVLGGSNHGGDIILNIGGNLELLGGNIDSKNPFGSFSGMKTFAFGGSGSAGNIDMNAEKIFVNGGWLGMFSASLSTGNSGNIHLQTNELEMVGANIVPVFITSLTLGKGQGGDVDINVKSGNISLDNAQITATTAESGTGGNVKVEAQNLQMINGSIVQTGTGALGNAGETDILLTGNLGLLSGSFIGSLVGVNCTESCGAAGNLKVEAKDITIQGVQNAVDPLSSPEFTGIRTRSVAELGGNVNISGNNLYISDNGVIRSASIGSERAGDITVSLKENLELDSKGQLLATAESSGNAGDITVLAKNINLAGDSSIKAESTSSGNAGRILLKTDNTVLITNSSVLTKAEDTGTGGAITIGAHSITLDNAMLSASVKNGIDKSGGSHGDISLTTPTLLMTAGEITAETSGSRAAGTITLNTGTMLARNEAKISALTSADGRAGNISITTTTGSLNVTDGAAINSGTTGTGAGGSISLMADQNFTLSDGATVSASSEGPGTAGAINIDVNAGSFTIAQGAVVDSGTTGTGAGGGISIHASDNISIAGTSTDGTPSRVLSQTTGLGVGGAISLVADQTFTLSDGATVSASSDGPGGNAGNINITGHDTILIDKATVTTDAAQALGGKIKLTANDTIQLVDSTIESTVKGDAKTVAGNIELDPDFIILQNSHILAKATDGQGGDITLMASKGVLVDAQSTLEVTSERGISGTVNIESPIQVLSGTIVPLPSTPVNVATLYAARCVAGEGGHFSTFVDSKSDSVTPTPGTFLASPFLPQLSSPRARALDDTETPSKVSEPGQAAPLHFAAYSPPVLFGHSEGMLSACP